jgi:hypothetical protein
MANTSAPFGFRQVSGNGSAPTFEQVVSFCAYDTGAMYFGDPIYRVAATGGVGPASPGVLALAGVFVGCKYLSVSQKRTVWSNYWGAADVASANSVEVYLVNDPNARFVAQVGGSTTTGLVAADIGLNVQFNYGTGNTANGLSGAFIVFNSGAVTSTLPFRVVSLKLDPPGVNGTEAGAYNLAVVAFNNVETRNLIGV